MDSKYSILGKNKPISVSSNSFSQNLKRKFPYSGSSSSAPPIAKKPHNASKHSNTQFKHNYMKNDSLSLANRNQVQDIQVQRKHLPVFAVREQ